MQVGTAHSIGNPNEAWLDSKGAWLTYIILIILGHLVILSVPFLDTATAWTMTNTVHNVVSKHLFIILGPHWGGGSLICATSMSLNMSLTVMLTGYATACDTQLECPTFSMFLVLHYLKGTPFETSDQGRSRRLTHWEQIDQGTQFTLTRKFFTLVPILLFMITSFYTKYDGIHFLVNALSLLILSLIPKFPQMYKVRLFGLNKY